MSLVTTCPSCGTVFRMLREQLDASNGWVRCGHCMEVFDAKSQFSALELASSFDPSASVNQAPNDSNLSFVVQAKKQAFWASSAMQTVLGALSVVLFCLLFLQMANTHQSAIHRNLPILAKLSQAICQYVTCPAFASRKIDAWVIDSVSFQKESLDSFRLSMSLKNTSTSSLLMPSIELSLLGSNDGLLVRHVIASPHTELANATLAGGLERALTFIITPQTSLAASYIVNTSDILGYRLVIFYP